MQKNGLAKRQIDVINTFEFVKKMLKELVLTTVKKQHATFAFFIA